MSDNSAVAPPENPNDVKFFREIKWFGLTRWTWMKIFGACMFGLFIFLLWLTEHRAEVERARDVQTQLQTGYDNCVSGNGVREELRTLIVVTYSMGGSIDAEDFKNLPGYEDMPESVQVYFANLGDFFSAGQTPEAIQERIDEALAQVPLRDCEELFPVKER